jgi:putative 4-mercaptohistidine N1-methyltranferase
MGAPNFYETDEALSEYLLFHYGTAEQLLPWSFGPREALDYPVRCVTECLDAARLPATARGLDLGCAVGRSTFELARHCREVIGVDYSQRFIDVSRQLQRQGSLTYAYREEGLLMTPATAVVPADIDRGRVSFEQGDAEALRPDLGSFDVVLIANLLDRLPRPRQCLSLLRALVRSGGQLIITTPCTWSSKFTAPEEWLGGFAREGVQVRALATIREVLEADFELAQGRDMPFLIREHARKFQWSVAQGSVWLRR